MKNINYFRNLKINALVVFISIIISSINGQVSGTVFRDFNGNGIRDTWNSVLEPSIGNVTIKAYNTSGNEVGSVTSGPTNGSYSFSALSGMIRLELELPGMEYDGAFGTGNGNKSTIRFVNASTNPSNVNFALSSPDEYFVSTDPKVFTIRYCNGNMNTGTISGNTDIVLAFNYSDTGRPASQGGSAPEPQHIASGSSVGSVWGTAYSKQSNKLFVSSFLKRHVGMGPGGSGAIYMLDVASPPAAGTVPPYASLDAMGFPTQGSGSYSATPIGFHPVIGTNAQRGLPDGGPVPSADASAFGQVGKVSLGDLDISTDGKYLFSINLYDRKIYRIDLGNPNNPTISNSSTVKTYSSLPWFSLDNSNGKARPFALRYYKGNIYVGVVTTEENSTYPGNSSLKRYPGAMRAYIYKIDPESNGSGTIVLEFPLNYTKETAGGGDGAVEHGWYIWSDNFNDYFNPGYVSWSGEYPGHNSPILSDIEFDSEGSMMLAFMDRSGHQWGIANVDPLGQNSHTVIAGGDILRTYYDKLTDTYTLEANGIAGPYNSNSVNGTSGTVDVNTGPGTPNGIGASFTGYTTIGREFFYMDCALIFGSTYPNPHHNEGINGGLALFGPSGQVMCSGLDPDDCCAYSGGVYKLSTTDGSRTNGYNLFTSAGPGNAGGFLGKANGMGDVEVLNDVPPLEIGNLVWNDANSNGIQDAGEAGISGVSVQLYNAAGTTLISTATTDANGNYIFSSGTGTSTAAFKYGITQLIPNTNYIIRVPTSTGGLNLTTANAGSKNTIDSDAPSSGDVPVLASEIPMAGANNHTFDIGYSPVSCTISLTSTPTLCTGANSNTYSLSGNVSFTNAPSSGYLIISVQGGSSQVFNAPFTSPVSYSINKLIADGASRSVTAYFSASPTCTASSAYTAPSPVGTGFYTFALNSTLSDAYYGLNPHKYTYVENIYMPSYPNWGGLNGEAFDLDLQPQGVTNLAGFCAELEEGMGGTTHYYNKYQIIPLENVTRGWAGIAGTTAVHIPVGGIGKVRAGMLRYLFDNYYNGTDLTAAAWTNENAAAFQFAVWEIIHESYANNNSFSFTTASTDGFYTTTSFNTTVKNLTNSYLTAINTLNWTDQQWMSYESQNYHVFAAENDPENYQDFVFAQPIICTASCSLTSAGKTNEACNNNGTPSNSTDDYITFSLNPTGTGLGTGYTVSVSGGASITPTSGTYGSANNFQLQNGSSNGTTYTITITDNSTGACQVTTTVMKTSCSTCPTSCFYTTSWYDGLVLKYDGELGTPSGSFGQPYINYAYDAEIGPDGMLYVASQYGDKIIKFNPATGAHLGDFVTAGSGGLDEPTGLTFGPDGNLYVSGTLSAAVHKYNGTTGASMGKFVDNTPAGVRPWQGIEFGPDGNLYVANENLSVEKYNGTTGAYMLTFAPTPGGHLQDLTFGPDGNLYLVEQGNNRVTKWNPATGAKISNFISTPGASTNTLTGASFGPDGNFYLAHWEPTGGISKYDGTTGAYIGEFIAVERPKEVLFVCGTCSEICSLTSAGKSNEACNSNNTQAITTDDYITFSLNPTGTGLGTGYTVTASGGATVTPTSGTYGSATNFQLQNGSANGTTYTITVTDNATGACQVTTTVIKTSCSSCPTPDCLDFQVIKN